MLQRANDRELKTPDIKDERPADAAAAKTTITVKGNPPSRVGVFQTRLRRYWCCGNYSSKTINRRPGILCLLLLSLLLLRAVPAAYGRGGGEQAALGALFPKTNEVAGWTLKEGPKFFADTQIFDYMDGAGEIPKSYDFRQLGSAKYAKGQTVLEVVIFDMGRSSDAFGYYSARSFLERTPRSRERILPFDHPAHLYVSVGVLTLWKSRYTVIVQPDVGVPDEATLTRFARAVSAKIKEKGQAPSLLDRLPSVGMATNSSRYVRGKSAFDSLLLFSPKDVFGASRGADAVGAEYGLPGAAVTLFVVHYPNAGAATGALAAYREYLTSRKAVFAATHLPNAFLAMDKREKGTGAILQGSLLGVVTRAKDAKAAEAALQTLRVGLTKRKKG